MTEETKKTGNAYTEDQTSELLNLWNQQRGNELDADARREFVTKLASKFGKSSKSVIQKLVREKVYTSPTSKVGQVGQVGQRKADIVTEIEAFLSGNYTESDADSLTKATKPILLAIHRSFAALKQELAEQEKAN